MSPELEAALERARNHVMSPRERFERKVSFVYGMQGRGGRSKEEIRKEMIAREGYPMPTRGELLDIVERHWNAGPDALVDAILGEGK